MRHRRIVIALIAAVLPVVGIAPVVAAPGHPFAKCAPGKIKVHRAVTTKSGTFFIEVTEAREFEDFVCVITPTFRYSSQEGITFARFPDHSAFKTDSLGHIFYNLYPGQEKGVGVIVFDGKQVTQLGIYDNGRVVQHARAPFAIRETINSCRPTCASGHVTHKLLTWHPATKKYS